MLTYQLFASNNITHSDLKILNTTSQDIAICPCTHFNNIDYFVADSTEGRTADPALVPTLLRSSGGAAALYLDHLSEHRVPGRTGPDQGYRFHYKVNWKFQIQNSMSFSYHN